MKQLLSVRSLGLLILTCLLLFPTSGWADVYYVDIENGNNGNAGTSPGTGAWKTLHHAVDQLGEGDVLNVAPGTYSFPEESDANLEITQSYVTIQGIGDVTSTVIKGLNSYDPGVQWKDGLRINADHITIRGLALADFRIWPQEAGIRVVSGIENIIEACEIYNNRYGIYVRNTSPKIRRNRLYDNLTGIHVDGNMDFASPDIWNNLIYSTTGTTMNSGIYVDANSGNANPRIYHNTIDGGNTEGVYITAASGSSIPDIKYNIITNFYEDFFNSYGIRSLSATPNIAYNDVWNNKTADYDPPTLAHPGDISYPPLYASYSLQPTSQCINAIPVEAGDLVGYDIDGNRRPQGQGFDMGAYEQVESSVETIPVPPGTEVPEYVMVSFTVEPENPSCPIVFGDEMGGAYDPENYRIGGYDPTLGEGGYRECDTGLVIEPGRAYWMLARYGLNASVGGTPTSLNDTEVPLLYSAAIGNGWNQIGCPNAANYMWETVEVLEGGVSRGTIADASTDGLIDKRLWCWEAGTYHADAIYMEQGQGYWVRAMRANVSLMFRQSAQMASLSNQDIMFARLLRKGKRWVKRCLLGPPAAIADSGDTPPMPMGAISKPVAEEERSDGGGGGCLIDTTARWVLGR